MHGRMTHLTRVLTAALGALAIALTLAGSALAAKPTAEPSSQPALEGPAPLLDRAAPTGYYLWHDENGFHLRTHGPGSHHRFEARLRTDGVFADVDAVRLESRDDVAVLDGGHTLVLRLRTYDATDGVNFRVRGGDWLRLSLRLDGAPIPTERIYLGGPQSHPPRNPFTVPI